jgi:hypothetical protein
MAGPLFSPRMLRRKGRIFAAISPFVCLTDQWFRPEAYGIWSLTSTATSADCGYRGSNSAREGSGRVIAVCRRSADQASGHRVNPANPEDFKQGGNGAMSEQGRGERAGSALLKML